MASDTSVNFPLMHTVPRGRDGGGLTTETREVIPFSPLSELPMDSSIIRILKVDQLRQCLRPHIPVELPSAFHANTTPEGGRDPIHDQHLPALELTQPPHLMAALLAFNDHFFF
jgi:hypothetical protein